MLEQGWAMNLAMGPNLRYQACYRSAQQKARRARAGVWGHRYFRVLHADQLPRQFRTGFHQIEGRIDSIKFTSRVIWINLAGRQVALKINARDRQYFNDAKLKQLRGRRATFLGYVVKRYRPHPRFGGYIMLLRHPDSILN